ncbi:AMP-binding protein [Nonomuraea sp. NPDC050556]|uniref:AMP-binding protein n=1 Tax=Nonomuraea sp. NPDC050556 TaxID=3364369 RepID=UPI0037A42DED
MEQMPDWGTFPRMLRDQAARHPDVPVVVEGDTTLTMLDLRERASAVARGLIALGVRPGDRVALWGVNDASWVVQACGIWDAGAVIVPLSSRYKGLEAAEMIAKTGAEVLLVGASPPGTTLAALLPHVKCLRHVVTSPMVAHVSREEAEERALAVRPDDLMEIMSTSGTTGTPKGVMLDHAQILRGYWDWAEIVTLEEGDRYPVIAPFSHGFGLNAGLIASIMRRATMMPVKVFSPDGLMTLIASGRIAILAGPPTLFYRLLDELDRADWDVSSLRIAICGAAAVPDELIVRLLDRVGLDRMINAYGLMEGTVVTMTRAEDPVEVIAGTAGRPVPGIEVKIVDDDGKEVASGERGEILQRGYGVMRGYWDEPDKTAEAIDADGWLHTGDIGVADSSGNISIVDRKKELFIVNGFNVSPAEVEAMLLREGSLAQAAVIGVPDAASGEVGLAYVVPRLGVNVSPDTLTNWAKQNMSNYKVPRRIVVVDALPVNANGKIDKLALRAASGGTDLS